MQNTGVGFPFHIVDLTHTLSSSIPSWNGSCGFSHTIKLDYNDTESNVKFRIQQLKMHAGIGIHLDSPSHCFPDGLSIADLNIKDLIAPCIVIDVSDKAHEKYVISIKDITNFESKYGPIRQGNCVIFYTGWDKRWSNAKMYHNNLRFPCISEDVAFFLLEKDIAGIGIDTLSPDRPDIGFPVHNTILGANKYIIENVTNAHSLPPIGCYGLALPIKISQGTEAPIRLLGFIPKNP